jgi:serine/threonine protein phosphatase 1
MDELPVAFAKFTRIPQPEGRVFAIGDVHGCCKELELLLDELVSQWKVTNRDRVIFLGDFVDRGPDSCGVINRVIEFCKDFPNTICLRGNHEDMLIDFLGQPGGTMGEMFLPNGGVQTLESYGISDELPPAEIARLFPPSHLEFLLNLKIVVETDTHIFVHAGLNPKLPMDYQLMEDVLWIRGEFLYEPHTFGKVIVFGHTPFHEVVDDRPHKIGIDTGLVFGNKLTCLNVTHLEAMQVARGGLRVFSLNLSKQHPSED